MRVDAALRHAVRELGLSGRALLLAVSGGVDSVVMLHGLHRLAPALRLRLAVGHVHHGLRGAEADRDRDFVARLAAERGLPFFEARVDPPAARRGRPSRERPTIQEAARRLRYEVLESLRVRAGADAVCTAHHRDDQAETVLLRLLRGTGPDGLGGIPERSRGGRVVRPLLRVSRADILALARREGLTFREDASNASPRYTRNRVRRELLPLLQREFNPQLLRALSDLAEAQRRDAEWIAGVVAREAGRRIAPCGCCPDGLVLASLAGLPDALARRVAREALRRAGGGREVSRRHLERMLGFLARSRPGARLELPPRLVLERRARAFHLGRSCMTGAPLVLSCEERRRIRRSAAALRPSGPPAIGSPSKRAVPAREDGPGSPDPSEGHA